MVFRFGQIQLTSALPYSLWIRFAGTASLLESLHGFPMNYDDLILEEPTSFERMSRLRPPMLRNRSDSPSN